MRVTGHIRSGVVVLVAATSFGENFEGLRPLCAPSSPLLQHGEGFATKNSGPSLEPFSLNQPPALGSSLGSNGPECPGTFASEFGGVAIASFESLSPTLSAEHWALHSNPMKQRNYAVDNFVVAIANSSWPASFNTTGQAQLQAKLYFAQISQALLLKSAIETRRSTSSWGCIIWQLNEIWPTGEPQGVGMRLCLFARVRARVKKGEKEKRGGGGYWSRADSRFFCFLRSPHVTTIDGLVAAFISALLFARCRRVGLR
jgi:hypothetical protein